MTTTHRDRAAALLDGIDVEALPVRDRLKAAQIHAILEQAEQTRLQTLLFCRQSGDIIDVITALTPYMSNEAQQPGANCACALTDDDLKTLGVGCAIEDFFG